MEVGRKPPHCFSRVLIVALIQAGMGYGVPCLFICGIPKSVSSPQNQCVFFEMDPPGFPLTSLEANLQKHTGTFLGGCPTTGAFLSGNPQSCSLEAPASQTTRKRNKSHPWPPWLPGSSPEPGRRCRPAPPTKNKQTTRRRRQMARSARKACPSFGPGGVGAF